MIIRLLGAAFILFACGSFGFIISGNMKCEIIALQNFIAAIEYMECELRYRMSPLPDLCNATSLVTKGIVSKIFESLGGALKLEISPSVSICMANALEKQRNIPNYTKKLFEELGNRLGVFDLDGQLHVLTSTAEEARHILKNCIDGHKTRTRSCKTLALCAGAAIVILLI